MTSLASQWKIVRSTPVLNVDLAPIEEQEEVCACCAQTWRDCECADGKLAEAVMLKRTWELIE